MSIGLPADFRSQAIYAPSSQAVAAIAASLGSGAPNAVAGRAAKVP